MSDQRNSSETEELVRQASEGGAAAVDALLLRHRERLKRMVRLRMDPRVAARVDPSDVIQEAFVTALEQLPGYLETEPIPFYPWLRRIGCQTLAHQHERHTGLTGLRGVKIRYSRFLGLRVWIDFFVWPLR